MTAIFSCFIEEFNHFMQQLRHDTIVYGNPSDFVSIRKKLAIDLVDENYRRCDAWARLKSVLTAFSDHYFREQIGTFTAKFRFDCEATSAAKVVFEHPGGPYNKIPFGGFAPISASHPDAFPPTPRVLPTILSRLGHQRRPN